jgi:integrase
VATLYRRKTGYWYIKFKQDGKWVYASTGKQDRDSAADVMNDVLAGLAAGVPQGPPRSLSWKDLERRIAEYGKLHLSPATASRYLHAIKMFKKHSGAPDVTSVTPDDVDRFKTSRLGSGNNVRTVNNYLRDLRIVIGRAITQKWYGGENPFKAVRLLPEPKRHPLWLDGDQIVRLLAEAEKRGRNCHLFVALGIYAGLRKSEAVEARWSWFDFGAGLVHIRQSDTWRPKDLDERTLPMHDKLRAILVRYRGEWPDQAYVLAPTKEGGGKCRGMAATLVKEAEKKRTKLDPAPDFSWITPHVLRHTFASQLVSAGVDLYKVSVWLGHADVKTTQIYAHLKPADRDINRF